jgi:hypothetical protein
MLLFHLVLFLTLYDMVEDYTRLIQQAEFRRPKVGLIPTGRKKCHKNWKIKPPGGASSLVNSFYAPNSIEMLKPCER